MATKKKEAPTISDPSQLKRLPDTEFIESGNVGLDMVLSDGKGIPMRNNIMLYGLPGTGKTTLFCDLIKRILDRCKAEGIPMRMHYIDSESSRDLLKSAGVWEYVYDAEEYAPQQVIYHEAINSFKHVEAIYKRMMDQKDNWGRDIKFVFIDSVTKLLADSQLVNEVDKADFGDNAKARKKFYGKWLVNIQALGITQFWITQMAVNQGAGPYAATHKPAVSTFDEHNMDIILKLTANKDTNKADVNKTKFKTIQGDVEVVDKYILTLDPGREKTHVKNRLGQNLPVDVLLWRGHGVINAYILRDMLLSYDFLRYKSPVWDISQDLADYLGEEALEAAGITTLEGLKRPLINRLCSMNNMKIINMLKTKGLYHVKLAGTEENEEADGLF